MTEKTIKTSGIDFEALTAEIEAAVLVPAQEEFHHYYLDKRPIRPYNLEAVDLEPGLRVSVLNAGRSGDARLRCAQHFIAISDVFTQTFEGTSCPSSSFVWAHRVVDHVSSRPVSGDKRSVCAIPLSHMGIEPDPLNHRYDAHAYAVPYTALADDPKLVLYC